VQLLLFGQSPAQPVGLPLRRVEISRRNGKQQKPLILNHS